MSFRSTLGEWLEFIAKVFCGSVIIMGVIFSVWAVGPSLENRYFPVVSKLKIADLRADSDGNAIIMAEFTKVRNCEYLGVAWYRGSRNQGFERVPVILQRRAGDRSNPNRPLGTQRSGPWLVGMPVVEIDGNSFAELFHRCHPFWISKTDFYP